MLVIQNRKKHGPKITKIHGYCDPENESRTLNNQLLFS